MRLLLLTSEQKERKTEFSGRADGWFELFRVAIREGTRLLFTGIRTPPLPRPFLKTPRWKRADFIRNYMESREQVLSLIKRGTPISRKRVEKGGWKTDASSPRCYFYVLPIGFALRSCSRSSIEARRQFDFFSRVVAVTCLSRRNG